MGLGVRNWLPVAMVVALSAGTPVAYGVVPDDAGPDAIRQQVRATSPTGSELRSKSAASAAPRLMRCFDLNGPTYCLGIGFTSDPPSASSMSASVAEDDGDGQGGALSAAGFVTQRTALSDSARADAEVAEIDVALAGAEKARALEAMNGAIPAAAQSNNIMNGFQTRQVKSYWCGPATFQSIDWADDNQQDTQQSWATDLGTTTGGTAISSMVSLTNSKTAWDDKAGAYIVQSVSSWTASKFLTVHQNHIGDADPAPIIEHPKLLKTYFPYLKYNHSGHFTVGRGYSVPNNTISYFEVFNEADWNSTGNQTWGIKSGIAAGTLLAATKANSSFQNIGL